MTGVFRGLHGRLAVADARFERYTFDNCSAHGGLVERVELVDCTTWACSLTDVLLEDCLVENLRTSPGGGGRTTPLFVWGGTARHVVLRGTLGGLVWNPPEAGAKVDGVRRYYEGVDWALDVSEARFRSVPAFRFGPPGRLIRRDPETQPLIDRCRAQDALARVGGEIGVWRVVLEGLVARDWPDEVVLVPPLGGPKVRYEEELAAIARLKAIGAFEAEP
jgi:hypothetical protein